MTESEQMVIGAALQWKTARADAIAKPRPKEFAVLAECEAALSAAVFAYAKEHLAPMPP